MSKYLSILLVGIGSILFLSCNQDDSGNMNFPRDLSIQTIEEQSRDMYEVNQDSTTTEIAVTNFWNDYSDSLSMIFMDDSSLANLLPPSVAYNLNITLESDSEIRFYGTNSLGVSFDTTYTYSMQGDKLFIDAQPDKPYFYYAEDNDNYYQPMIIYTNMSSLNIDVFREELYLTQSEAMRQTLINDPFFEVMPGDTLAINLYRLIYD
jgi:hypothetical protein